MSNLLPTREKTAIIKLYRRRFLSIVFFVGMGLFVVGGILLFPSIFVLKGSEAVLAAKRDALGGHETTKVETALASTITEVNKKLSVFPDVILPSPILGNFLDPILKVKGDAVHITNFSYGAQNAGEITISISGTTNSRADLLAFADKLKSNPHFKNVTVPIASFIKDANVTFTIGAVLIPGK